MCPMRRRRKASVGAHRLSSFRDDQARVPAINCGACGKKSALPPLATMPDLVAAALAQGDVNGAMQVCYRTRKIVARLVSATHLCPLMSLLFERLRGQSRGTGRQ